MTGNPETEQPSNHHAGPASANATPSIDLATACKLAVDELLQQRTDDGWWEGQLSTSALSTATAVMAMQQAVIRNYDGSGCQQFPALITNGLRWLANHQNEDGGWGDTVLSISNISTTMLVNAVFHATATTEQFCAEVESSKRYIDDAGGVPALMKRYGKDPVSYTHLTLPTIYSV